MGDKFLVDSDVFYALADIRDSNHTKALALMSKFTKQGEKFFTLNLVIYETATVLSHKINHEAALAFLAKLDPKKIEVLHVDVGIETKAFEIFRSQTRKNTSFVDCANMAMMKQYSQTTIFSFDEIYKRNGFKRVGIDE